MKRNRLLYKLSAWTVIASLLLMHVAVSAYACPSTGMASGCMGSLDTDQPSLCKKHGESQLQLSGGNFPPLPPAVLVAILLPLPTLVNFDDPNQSRLDSFSLSRLAPDGSPPLFLRLQVLLT